MAVVQHPYAESDQIRAGDVESFGRAGAIGLVGPFDFGGSKRASTGDLGTGGGDGVVVKSGDSGKKNAGVAAAVAVPISVCAAVIVVAVVAYQVWSKKQAAAGASGDKYAVNGNGKAANTV